MEDTAQFAEDFSLRYKVNFMEKACQFHTPLGRVLPPPNRRSQDSDGGDPNRIPLTTMYIASAPHGKDRTRLIQVNSLSHQHVTIAGKVT